mmetsp:Transcript_30419/g.83835  ORF Transcript_30419/g.83835 Transcript_30419/m.83835 type:complete len:246 (+) Transcript_30419:412-1149(+)
MKPASRKGSSGCNFTVGPGKVCTNCDSNCCMLLSCIIEAMALVSNVPTHSGASGPRLAPSVPSSSLPSSSSSPPSPAVWVSAFGSALAFLIIGTLYPSSSCGLRMSSAICLSTSKAPPPRDSSCVMARSVLRSTSRTCTGFRSASVACCMNSSSCNICWRSGQLSSSFCKRGSIFSRLRMKSWSFSRLCIAGDSSICCRMSGFCSTWRCSADSCGGICEMSWPSGPSPPPLPVCNKWMVLLRSTP